MYLDFFSLKACPYSLDGNETFFYESQAHAEALANMLYCVQQRKGMVLITGEVGAGKTLLGRMVAARLGPAANTVMLKHPPDSSKQLLRALAAEIATPPTDTDKMAIVNELVATLERFNRRGRTVVMIIDEAQCMPDDAMEEVRLMWNWEQESARLLQIILIGQPELRQRLRQPRWESLRQRIVLSYHLGSLSFEDTSRYVLHRRNVAASNGCPLRFTLNALKQIHDASGGIPRLVNVICDNALLKAYAAGEYKITSGTVGHVLGDMTCWPVQRSSPPKEDTSNPQ